MRIKWWLLLIVSMLLAFSVGSALAKNNHGKGRGNNRGDDGYYEQSEAWNPAFTEGERAALGRWYQDGRGLPPGLAKRDRLPPGLEKHLMRGGTLPPGLQKKIRPLPVVVERQLRVVPQGYRRGYVGGNVVIFNKNTSVIVDIMRLIP